MQFSTQEELKLAAEEANDEVFSDDHDDDAAALANVALNGSRTEAQAITLLVRAVLELAKANTADAQIALAAFGAAANILSEAITTVAEAETAKLVEELTTSGPVATFLKLLGFHTGGVVAA